MREKIRRNWKRIWYMVCFLLLGLIDQRRGSAVGETQMLFAGGTGIVMALLTVPSLDLQKWKDRVYLWWTPVCLTLTVLACVLGAGTQTYTGRWIVGVLNCTVWSYLLLYIIREWKTLEAGRRIRQPFFWCLLLLLVLMQLSEQEGILPLWYLVIFGGFYLIGVPREVRGDFIEGMLDGIILWFFLQQTVAFGFRPYDYVRYRGLYSGETQNGLFYLIVYCAFLLKWIGARERGAHWLAKGLYFLLSAATVGFMVFTGSRSALLGAVLVTVAVYTWYELVYRKSFSRWLLHGAALLLCAAVSLPVVYGCIRYLPTLLHHPIWFEGEYREGYSVCSFDPWNSEKYVSFEKAMEFNLGRILDALGMDYGAVKDKLMDSLAGRKVYAAEMSEAGETSAIGEVSAIGATSEAGELGEPGSTPDNPFTIEGYWNSVLGVRKVIYIYYWRHLNWTGHSKADCGFYLTPSNYITHAHDMFLQMAYDYGIPAGALFLMLYLYSILRTLRRQRPENLFCVTFLLAIGGFGLTEMVLVPGQITVALIWILFYFAGEDSKEGERK